MTDNGETDVRVDFKLSLDNGGSINEDQRLVFGWASVVETKEGEQVVDLYDHVIEELELEAAVYQFVALGGVASEMHVDWYAGTIIESMVFTKEKMAAMGIPAGTLPVGWWVGIRVYDQESFELIKNGTYKMFSIAGTAIVEDMPDSE